MGWILLVLTPLILVGVIFSACAALGRLSWMSALAMTVVSGIVGLLFGLLLKLVAS